MNGRADLTDYLQKAPSAPGVYVMKGAEGEVLYVGKAKNLKARVRAYISQTDNRPMIPFLVSRTERIDFIVTATEKEAYLLEYNLIKKHKPRYNILFRDDKAYFHLRLDPHDLFPRFQLVRRPRRDHARYFGPYPSGKQARETLKFLHTIFPLRTCRDVEMKNRSRPCLEYEIGRCVAPCVGLIDASSYRELVKESLAFMEGKADYVLGELEKKMREAAKEERFEDAALIRDRIWAIKSTLEKQTVYFHDHLNRDVFGLYREGNLSQISVIFVREGRVIGQRSFATIMSDMDSPEILSQFISFYYGEKEEIPDEIVIPMPVPEREFLAEWITAKKGKKVRLIFPRQGPGKELIQLALTNARYGLRESKAETRKEESLLRLAKLIGMPSAPERIECYDISHLGGSNAVGSQVTFLRGEPQKEAYRHYRIRIHPGQDDYAMMYEVITRRLKRGPTPEPDLIIVDGGKGHLSVAQAALKDTGKEGIFAMALAKGEKKGEEHLFLPHRKDPLFLNRHRDVLPLLIRIRDEAHRFAITYTRKKKEQAVLLSELDQLVGERRKRALLTHFKGVDEIRQASLATLMQVKGIGRKTAGKIRQYFNGGQND